MSDAEPATGEWTEILNELGEAAAGPAVALHWAESAALYAPHRLGFLLRESWQTSREWCGIDPALDAALDAVAGRILRTPPLARLAWHYSWRVWEDSDRSFLSVPRLETVLGENAGLFYVLIALDWVPRLRAWHRSLGIPGAVTRETCQQVASYMGNYARAFGGRPGVFMGQLSWLRQYLFHRFVRVGRFEFRLMPFDGEVEVYRHGPSGRVVALSAPGWKARRTRVVAASSTP